LFFKPKLNKKNKIKYLAKLFILRGDYSLIRIPIRNTFFNTFGLLIFAYNMERYETDDDETSPSYGWGKLS